MPTRLPDLGRKPQRDLGRRPQRPIGQPMPGGGVFVPDAPLPSRQRVRLSSERPGRQRVRIGEPMEGGGVFVPDDPGGPGLTRAQLERIKAHKAAREGRFRPGHEFLAKKRDRDGGGLLGTLSRIPGDTARGAYRAAVDTPAGLVYTGDALIRDAADIIQPPRTRGGRPVGAPVAPFKRSRALGKAVGEQVVEDFRHPLRDPFATATDVLAIASLGAGAVARASAVTKASKGSKLKAGLTKPQPGPRTVRVGDLEAKGVYSRNALVRGGQRVKDKGRQKAHDTEPEDRSWVQGRRAGALEKQAEKYLRGERRVLDTKARSAAIRLEKAGKKLKPEEQMALRLVAEGAPVRDRIAVSQGRAVDAKRPRQAKGHRERVDLSEKALAAYLDEGPDGRPIFKPGATKLRAVYRQIEKVAGDRETRLAVLDMISPDAAAKHKSDVGRVALADDTFEAPADAVYIGDPVHRSRLTGRPKVGAQTIGHPRLPGSITQGYTGKAKATAAERLDTTRIVAERNLEAVRLTSILRARDQLQKAGRAAPRHADDLFMRLDNLPSHRRLPGEVRRYLDNPEQLAELAPEQAAGIVDRVKAAIFSDEWKLDPGVRADFEKLAAQGKGVFVPRKIVGSLARRNPDLGSGVLRSATRWVDRVNNAQKLAVVYLKPGYVLPQVVSNAFLNLTQQGFAAPVNLARSIRLDKKLGTEHAAIVDDLMGEGFIRQLGGEGQVFAGRAASWTAGMLGRVVDTPFRRASFLHEARIAGYRTPDEIRRLLDDDALTDDLTQVVTRANQEIIDFSELGDVEQSVIRRVIFVYPWVKGSTVYAGRFLRDKPVQTAAYTQLGQAAQTDPDFSLGPTPSYLDGSFKFGGGLVNPAAASNLHTPAQVGRALTGLATGDRSRIAQPAGFASPATALMLALVTGRNEMGYPTGGALPAARDEFFEGQPLTRVARAYGALGGSQSRLYRDTGRNALGRFVFGSAFVPRQVNERELRKRAQRGD